MAYPFDFIKVTFGGKIYGNAEIWSNGINFGKNLANTGMTEAQLKGAAQAISGDIITWFKSGGANISSSSTLEWVKVALIGTDGKYVYDSDLFDIEAAAFGQSTSKPAPQLTTVITMETSRRRVPGRFARIYPPMNVPAQLTNGRITAVQTNGMRDVFVTLLNEMNDQLSILVGTPVRAIVASEKTTEHFQVLTVKVGDVVDTQRSRRNAFLEAYTESGVLLAPVAVASEPEPEPDPEAPETDPDGEFDDGAGGNF